MSVCSFISAGDPAFALQPVPKRQNLPAQAEQPDKASFMETAQKLIEEGGLVNHVSAGIFPAKELEPATEMARRALSVTAGFLLDKVWVCSSRYCYYCISQLCIAWLHLRCT